MKFRFFRIPAVTNFRFQVDKNELSKRRRERWLAAIKRDDLTETKIKYEMVCSRHFLTGKPAALEDVDHPDWAPSQNLGHASSATKMRVHDLERKVRTEKRKRKECTDVEPQIGEILPAQNQEEEVEGKYVETEITMKTMDTINSNLTVATMKLSAYEKQIEGHSYTRDSLQADKTKCRYYTGLTFACLETLYNYVENYIPTHPNSALNRWSQLILTLMKLRLNLDFSDLAYRFFISKPTVSSYFFNVVDVLYQRLKCFIVWPERDALKKNLPSCFKEVIQDKLSVIIDCFEVFIEKPSNMLTYQQCWSNYKHHTTVKFLIGITVCFISEAFGGRISDKQICAESKFFSRITPNDVLADRGFLIKDDILMLKAKLVVPAYTKGKNQLHPLELEETRSVAHVRVHVERIIGLIKNKFTFFKDTIPISMVCNMSEDDNSVLDKLVVICCALINISQPIVPE